MRKKEENVKASNMLVRCASRLRCLMKYNPTQSAIAHIPFSSAFKAGKNIQRPAKSADAWCTYKSHSRKDTARPLTTTIAPTTGRGLISACSMPTIRSQMPALVWLGEQLSQPIKAPFPQRPPCPHPSLASGEPFRLDPTGSHPPNFLGANQPALFKDLQVLNHRSQRDCQGLGQS